MKKLLFILSAVFVSVMSWAQNNNEAPYLLNPYAYDLTSSWDEATQKLTINFKLNSAPNLHDTRDANNNAVNGRGIQVFLVDSRGNEYYICGPSQDDIRKAHGATGGRHGSYSYTIDLSSGLDRHGNLIPRNEDLTWKVRVNGRKNYNASIAHGIGTGTQNYSKPRYWPHASNPAYQQRLISHSVDVVTNPQAPNFGRIMITDGIKVSTDNGWGAAHTDTYYSYTEGRGLYILEPDFVNFANNGKRAALNSNKNGGFVDPLEPREVCVSDNGRIFVSSASKTSATAVWELSSNYKTWTAILTKSTLGNRRVVAMDTKGAGDAITLLLLCAPTNANTPLTCYEYNLQTQALTTISLPNNVTSCTPYIEGINFQAKVQYASNGDIWVGLGNDAGSRVVRVVDDLMRTYGSSYGGEAFVIKNNLMIKSSRTSGDADILFKRLDNGNNYFSENITGEGIGMDSWITDFAIDYADNVFVASNYHGRVIPISLPYDGVRSTPAPSDYTFTISDPVPNILATDLTYAPYGNENKYEFSFNVNTKPELAQIRFYENEADMLANNENYSFYYEFSEAERKQGRMWVIFDAVGGKVNNDKTLADKKLPRGEFYWNVYVKTRKSNVFAPIYTQPVETDPHRQHATVDNNPNNRGFGHIYVADHHNIAESANRKHYVRAYTIGNATGNAQQDNQSNINDNTRYTTYWQVKSNNKVRYTRRPVVSPDGMVYIADEGANQKSTQPTWFKDPNLSTYGFAGAGLHVLDPNKQTNNEDAVWEANFSNPHGTTGNQEVTTGAYFLYKDGGWKLYRTNTYEEYTIHPKEDGTDYNYQNNKWINNGYRVYSITSTANGLVHSEYNDNQTTKRAFGAGDAGGQFSIVATEYGVWMCQHREKTVAEAPLVDGKPSLPDNKENIVLSFFDHSGNRKFTSYTYDNGNLTQKTSSPLQSTPGAGMAYQKRGGVEYLYLVNHAGNILEFKIEGGAAPTLTHTQTYVTGNDTKGVKYGAISSMNFDYAGNLVVTAGATYGVNGTDVNGNTVVRDHQELVIYTMPYPNQVNARAIPASEMYRYIPERVADDFIELDLLLDYRIANDPECYVDIYRPMLTGMLNTICLPFDIDTRRLDATDYYDATLLEFSDAVVTNPNGEKILELRFTTVEDGVLEAGVPYLIQAKNPITGIVQLKQAVTFTQKQGQTVNQEFNDGNNSIAFTGIMSTQLIAASKPWPLILVDNNRLAEVKNNGNMRGFRAYFQLANELDPGTKLGISTRKPTPTNVITIDGKRVNIEKFLREGRVYIRVGDSLYTISGEKVE